MKAPVNILVLILLFLSTAGLVAQFSQADMALDLDDARTFRAYPTYEHYQQLMQDFASGYPDICRLDTFGTTPGGRQLLALKISGNPGAEEAAAPLFYTSTMHGQPRRGPCGRQPQPGGSHPGKCTLGKISLREGPEQGFPRSGLHGCRRYHGA